MNPIFNIKQIENELIVESKELNKKKLEKKMVD